MIFNDLLLMKILSFTIIEDKSKYDKIKNISKLE